MRHSKSSLFLIELIISLFFFSLSSAVCVQLFEKTHTLSTHTRDLNYGVTQAQNLAEAFFGFDGDMLQLQALYENSQLSNDMSLLTIHEDNYCSTLLCTSFETDNSKQTGNIISAEISIYHEEGSEPIYTLHVDHYIAERMVTNE